MKIRKTETKIIQNLLSASCNRRDFDSGQVGVYNYIACDYGSYRRSSYGMRDITAARKLAEVGVLVEMDSHDGFETIRNSFSHHWTSTRFVAGPNFALAVGGQKKF